MTNLKNRIKTIEKRVIPEPPKNLHNLIMYGWYKDSKTHYKNRDGLEKEYVKSEHKEKPIFRYLNRGGIYPHN